LQKVNALAAELARMKAYFRPGLVVLFPFRPDDLPDYFYHANGDLCLLSSPQGQALNALPQEYKDDYKIVANAANGTINLANWYATDGRGYFPRASATPGAVQQDMIRNIEGVFKGYVGRTTATACTGALYGSSPNAGQTLSGKLDGTSVLEFPSLNASLAVPTGPENRPINMGVTPAMFLGC
jgi:hypothetical protein